MLVVLIKFRALLGIVEAIEIGEEVRRVARLLRFRLGAPHEIVDDRLGVDLFLNIKRRRLHDEIGPVLPVLAAPDKLRVADLDLALLQQLTRLLLGHANARAVPDNLRIEILVALARLALRQRRRAWIDGWLLRMQFLKMFGDRLIFRGRNIFARRALMGEGFDFDGFLGHRF